MNEWKKFESKWINLWPRNPTQTAYIRFRPKWGDLPETKFDKEMKKFRANTTKAFETHYLDKLEDYNGRDRFKSTT